MSKPNNNNKSSEKWVEIDKSLITYNTNIDAYKDLSYKKAKKSKIPKNIYYAIEYPFNVKNPDKAIELVGGLNKITKVFQSKEKAYLPLHFRPGNPDSKPVFGSTSPTCNLLLRVRKVNPSNNEGEGNSKNESSKLDTQIIATIPTTIKYDGLADFQYNVRENHNITKGYFSTDSHTTTSGSSINLGTLPPLFSRMDFEQKYLFKTNATSVFNSDTKSFTSKKQEGMKVITFFTYEQMDDIPSKPPPPPSKLMLNYHFKTTFEILKKMFDEKPIWTSIALADVSSKRGACYVIKNVLRYIAFSLNSGPWRRTFVRYGYDPRYDPDSRFYQTWDFRVGGLARFENYNEQKKKVIEREGLIKEKKKQGIDDPNSIPQPLNNIEKTISQQTPSRKKTRDINTFSFKSQIDKDDQVPSSSSLNNKFKPPYDYTLSELPTSIFINHYYQIADIEDTKLKAYFQNLPVSSSCHKEYGWFPSKVFVEAGNKLKARIGVPYSKRENLNLIENEDKIMIENEIDEISFNLEGIKDIERLRKDMEVVENFTSSNIFSGLNDDDDEMGAYKILDDEDETNNNNNNSNNNNNQSDNIDYFNINSQNQEDQEIQREDDENENENDEEDEEDVVEDEDDYSD